MQVLIPVLVMPSSGIYSDMELGLELFVTLLCILSSRGYRQGGLENLYEVYLTLVCIEFI